METVVRAHDVVVGAAGERERERKSSSSVEKRDHDKGLFIHLGTLTGRHHFTALSHKKKIKQDEW